MHPYNNSNQGQPPLGFSGAGSQLPPPYPPQGAGAPYPPQQQYPPQGAAYPPQPQYSTQSAQYPQQGAGYPPQYPQQGPGYPQQYPHQGQGAGYPAPYPTQQAGYPTQPQPAFGAGGDSTFASHFNQPIAYPPSPFAQPLQQQQSFAARPCVPFQPTLQQSFGQPAGNTFGTPIAMSQQYQDVPTIVESGQDPSADAQILRKAMKGIGTDEKAIINVLARRTDRQRQQIAQAFKTSFGKDLIKDLKSELGGKLEDVVLALMTPRFDYLATQLHKAISGLGTKESMLVDVMCTATNQEIHQINAAYQRLYKVPLEKDLRGDTSGAFGRLLVSMSTGARVEDPVANAAMATDDAQKLLSAGEKKWGTDESAFNMVLATRSYAQLRLMFHEYERLTGHAFERAIEREFSGDVEKGMMAIVKCAKSRASYFAQRLHDSIAGMGTKDNDLIFIMVTRAEIDLGSVSVEYQKMYKESLANAISGDTSGDYKKVLLALLGM